jgi:peptidoglycan/xylan/chitin deacetylase (PgdA/CDA1 family)
LTSRELGELDSAGVSVENHSWSHPCLSTCGEDKIEDEIGRAGRLLEDRLGRSPVAFAYPDGDRDERVSGTVRRSGHRLAFLFDHRMSALRPPDPFHVSRLRLDAHASIDRLQIILSGLHPSIHRIRRLP